MQHPQMYRMTNNIENVCKVAKEEIEFFKECLYIKIL
jgi:hypothetical protein